jgi:3-methylcrotonyl-CoA carboxylase alpha subunit
MEGFKTILIANRGEIAMRIIRSVHNLGIKAVAVYAENDRLSPHVFAADEAVSLGEGNLGETYLNIPRLVAIALEYQCQAVHPGYGFLSERAAFAEALEAAGICFIGPEARAIRLMGNKVEARTAVQSLGVPVIEGRTGKAEELKKSAASLAFPLLIKAAAGGGGKGMRIVRKAEELDTALEATAREALTYFGDDTVYAERYLEAPRHIEVQVFGDQHGNAVHFFERECSLQRRYQKIIEEAPSPTVTPDLREHITAAALDIAKGIGYSNAGTIEFLLDQGRNFFFLEMNTRIQVEHPVTEMITGFDLVEEQIRVASGLPLSVRQEEIQMQGHAIECRVYAEDPRHDFLPSPGTMSLIRFPEEENIRIESGIPEDLRIQSDYDPMIAKIVVWEETREAATARMLEALNRTLIHGIESNLAYLKRLLEHPAWDANQISTLFCDTHHQSLTERQQKDHKTAMLAYLLWWFDKQAERSCSAHPGDVWTQLAYWRAPLAFQWMCEEEPCQIHIHDARITHFSAEMNGKTYTPSEIRRQDEHISFTLNRTRYEAWVSEPRSDRPWISMQGDTLRLKRDDVLVESAVLEGAAAGKGGDPNRITSPMPGKVVKVNVETGEKVKAGQVLMIVEAMKMENSLLAASAGVVKEINVRAGDKVDTSKVLVLLKPDHTSE